MERWKPEWISLFLLDFSFFGLSLSFGVDVRKKFHNISFFYVGVLQVILILILSSCSIVRDSLTGYVDPVAGPVARMRFIGSDPEVFSSSCPDLDAKPSGHINEWSKGRRSIGMPLDAESQKRHFEAYIIAGRPVTIMFNLQQPVAPKGYYFVPKYRLYCPGTSMSRTFTPKSGHDYESKLVVSGECVDLHIYELLMDHGSIVRSRVYAPATKRCESDAGHDVSDK